MLLVWLTALIIGAICGGVAGVMVVLGATLVIGAVLVLVMLLIGAAHAVMR